MARWKRTLGVTAVAQGFSIMGFSFVTPFLPLFVQELGVHGAAHITLWAGILAGGTAIPMALAAPVWGLLADRYGRKMMVVRAALSAAVLVALMGLAQNVYQLLVLRMLQGALTGTVSASQALVASQSPRNKLGFSLGLMQTAVFVGTSLGPLSGGLFADALGFRRSFVGAGILLFTSGLLVLFFVREEPVAVAKDQPRVGLVEGFRDALRTPALLAMLGAVFAVQFGITVVFPVLPQFIQYLQGPAGHAATVTGLIFTGAGIAGAISSTIAGRVSDRIGYKQVLVAASLAAAVLSVPQYFVNATWQIGVLRIVIGFALGAIMPSASALVGALVPAERRGTAFGLSGSATSLGFAAGPLTAAAVVSLSGMRAVFLTASVLLSLIAVWVGLMVHPPSRATPGHQADDDSAPEPPSLPPMMGRERGLEPELAGSHRAS